MSSSADADQMASTDKAVGDAEKDLSTMQAQTHMQETMDDNESEWEYEYSPNETEVYIYILLNSHYLWNQPCRNHVLTLTSDVLRDTGPLQGRL